MKKIILLFLSACSLLHSVKAIPPDTLNSTLPSYIKVANWYNFHKAAYSLTFDDGLSSQHDYLEPILSKYQLKATFFIITGSLQENPEQRPQWRFGYWHKFIEMSAKGHEIGSHTVTHPRLTSLKDGSETSAGTLQYELSEPIRAIQEKIPGYPVISFAYPFVDYNVHVKEESLKRYPAVRAAGRSFNNPEQVRWGDLQATILEYSGNRTVASDCQKMTGLQNFLQDGLIEEGSWGIYLAHDVLPLSEAIQATDSWHPVSTESFEQFAKWLKTKQDSQELWVAPMGAVTRYIKEKENLVITEKEKTENKLVLLLNDGLPDELYNQPLTMEVMVPAGWKKIKILQGRKKEILIVTDSKIKINALPIKDPLEILRIE